MANSQREYTKSMKKTSLLKKILYIAQNDRMALGGFLQSLGSHIHEEKMDRIRELK